MKSRIEITMRGLVDAALDQAIKEITEEAGTELCSYQRTCLGCADIVRRVKARLHDDSKITSS